MQDEATNTEYSFVVSAGQGRVRLDRFLGETLRDQDVSREKIKRAIREGGCRVDDEVCMDVAVRLATGQRIELCLKAEPTSVQAEEGALEIVYQDEHLAIVNKLAGMTVHPAPSCPEGTLVHRLVAYFPSLRAQEGFRPGIVHRLDKDTSGLICVALTEEARLRLSEAFAAREIHKEYLGLVRGVPAPCGTVDAPLGRHPSMKVKVAVVKNGKPAQSEWRVLHAGREYALISVRIHTGRTHQIRVHMAHVGYPLFGDALYGYDDVGETVRIPQVVKNRKGDDPAPRQMLHAWKLGFVHPFTGEKMAFCCPPPKDFVQTVRRLEKSMRRVVVTGVAGCGKSFFVRSLAERGIPVWSADAAVIRLYEPGQEAWSVLRQRYGDRFVPDDKSPVDRKALAAALLPQNASGDDGVQSCTQVDVHELEALLHPLVFHDLLSFWQGCEEEGRAFAVAEVPLWFESHWSRKYMEDAALEASEHQGYARVVSTNAKRSVSAKVSQPVGTGDVTAENRPFVVGVFCEEEERQRRLLKVRGWSPELMARMDALQWTQERKMSACDEIIPNSGTVEDLEEQVTAFIRHMEEMTVKNEKAFQEKWQKLVEATEMESSEHTF